MFDGFVNKVFIGDAATVVGEDGLRWYKPENIKPEADYDELVAIPMKIVKIFDVTDWGDVINTDVVYKKLLEK